MNSRIKRILLFSMILLLAYPTTLAATTESPEKKNNSKPHQDNQQAKIPSFTNVSVHDPSIIKEGDTYYVFGTHIEAAKSDDLMNWERFTNGYTTPGNTLYGDLSENLAGSFEWAGEDDSDSKGGFAVWAPDVIYNKDYVNEDGTKGAYMIYYSASSTYIRSAIGYAVSKNIEGPYNYVDTIVYSGFTEEEDYDANSDVNKQWENTHIDELINENKLTGPNENWFREDGSYNNTMYPNAIDATMFYDKDGKLWMTYGSWSGGIFLLEIDKDTGQPIYPSTDQQTEDGRIIDRYFGTKISGGYGKSGEGPYIVYHPETEYYYLYVTYGWLGAGGEYNMRVSRSKNPDGPYQDADGQNVVIPGNVDHANYGNKLMGHFMFERKVGDPGSGIGYGYISPGHNSVYYDDETGKQFLVFHSRFPERGEEHEVRVHQLFMNKDGWPVAAPYRYSGETLDKVKRQDIIGDYQLINHGLDISTNIHKDVDITLEKNNKITGVVTGTWKKTGHNQAELSIDGSTYKGVFVRQYDPVSERHVMTFTASSEQGKSVWGSKQTMNKTDAESVADVKEDLTLGDTSSIQTDLTLPTEGTRGTQITWISSNPEVVTEQGEVTRPEPSEDSVTLTLTATITKGDIRDTKSFTITVIPKAEKQLVAHYGFEDNLEDSLGNFGKGLVTGNRIDNTGGTINYTNGVVGKASIFNGNSGVRLPDNLINGTSYSVSLWLYPETLTGYTTSFFGAKDSSNWVSLLPGGFPGNNQVVVWSGGPSFYEAPTEFQLQINEWTHLAFTVDDGEIIIYINGEEKLRETGFNNVFTTNSSQFGLGVNWWDPPYKGLMDELSIYNGKLTAEEVKGLAEK